MDSVRLAINMHRQLEVDYLSVYTAFIKWICWFRGFTFLTKLPPDKRLTKYWTVLHCNVTTHFKLPSNQILTIHEHWPLVLTHCQNVRSSPTFVDVARDDVRFITVTLSMGRFWLLMTLVLRKWRSILIPEIASVKAINIYMKYSQQCVWQGNYRDSNPDLPLARQTLYHLIFTAENL